jgi:hypothetical protein
MENRRPQGHEAEGITEMKASSRCRAKSASGVTHDSV